VLAFTGRNWELGNTYSKWKRPGKSDTRRSPSSRTIVVSEVVVLLGDGIYLLMMDFGQVGLLQTS
jgi:hypothetical protein